MLYEQHPRACSGAERGVARELRVACSEYVGGVYIGGSRQYKFSANISSYTTGMGYNELQYNLPRWKDLTITRQGMYDDT